MTRTKKYNFKVKYNVEGFQVPGDFEESKEVVIIDKFEEITLNLLEQNKQSYSMIELGSNYAYYSLLFNRILKDKDVTNIMIEPQERQYQLGEEHFRLNNIKGHFYKAIIGKNKKVDSPRSQRYVEDFNYLPLVSFEELFRDHNLNQVDLLHCDIQGHEVELLEEYLDWFQNKKFKYIFIATHNIYRDAHNFCKEQFNSLPYQLVFEEEKSIVGGDSFLIYKLIEE